MKTVAKAILHQNKKALLQFRDDKESIPHPATWSLFGGEIEEGETPKSCIQREIKEEIGFTPTNVKLMDNQVRTEGDEKVRDYIFGSELSADIDKLCLQEGQALGFFTEDEVKNLNITPHYESHIFDFFQRNND